MKKISAIIILFFLLVGIVSVAYLQEKELQRQQEEQREQQREQQEQREQQGQREQQEQEQQLQQTLVAESISVKGKGQPVVDSSRKEPAVEQETIYCEAVIDFEALQEENKDAYAWVNVPGTEIDYPILQSEEDNYYLNRNLDGSEGYPGSIYTNKCNAKDFSDALTVMYGHNMKNGSMFAGLHQFEDADFFENYNTILIYTEEARYTYEICAAAAYNNNYIPSVFDVTKEKTSIQFYESLLMYEDARKLVREGVELTQEDKLLVLSTCISNESTKRYFVVGRLVETALVQK